MKPLARKPQRRRKSTQTIEQRNSRLSRMANTEWGKDEQKPKVPEGLGHFTTHNHPDTLLGHGSPVPKHLQYKTSQVAKDIKKRDAARERGELDDEEFKFGENKPEPKHYIDFPF